jgi:hypothetical protein
MRIKSINKVILIKVKKIIALTVVISPLTNCEHSKVKFKLVYYKLSFAEYTVCGEGSVL